MLTQLHGLTLLVPDPDAQRALAIELSGQRWGIEIFTHSEGMDLPAYTCVSYAWGSAKMPHPFEPGVAISRRALSVLGTSVRVQAPQPIWIDALCVPNEEPARAVTLRRLGAIYAEASGVTVVLSADVAPLFEQCASEGTLDAAALRLLERESWVSRAWTYQELANSKQLRFVAEGASAACIDATQLLNCVGQALHEHDKLNRLALGVPKSFPSVDNLTDVLATWQLGVQSSAYQILSGMAHRFAERAADRFNAVLGSVDLEPLPDNDAVDLRTAAERFMTLCESKGDLSFIYSSAPRSDEPGRSWRPVPGELPALLAWHSFGSGQHGTVHRNHVQLEALFCPTPGPLLTEGREFITRWLGAAPTEFSLADAIQQQLVSMGFSGNGDAIEFNTGYLLPYEDVPRGVGVTALIATGIRWAHGAPGLIAQRANTGHYRCIGLGVFVGVVPNQGDAFDIE